MADGRKIAFEVKWRIEKVNSWFQTRDDPLYSHQFLASTLKNTHWKLSLSTYWQFKGKYLSLTVLRDVEDNGPEFITLNYELTFLACDDSEAISKSFKSRFASETVGHKLNVKYVEILTDGSEAYLPEGVLTVSCKFWYDCTTVSEREQCLIRSVIGKKCITLDGSIDNFRGLFPDIWLLVNFSSPSSDVSFLSLWFYKDEGGQIIYKTKEVECKRFVWYHCTLFASNQWGQKIKCFAREKTVLESCSQWDVVTSGDSDDFSTWVHHGKLLFQLQITYFPGIQIESIEYDFNKTDVKTIAYESTDVNPVNSSSLENPNNISQSDNEKYITKVPKLEETKLIDISECLEVAGSICLPFTTMQNDLTSLYNDSLFCDTKLLTDTETFPAHRCVLSARSPVFKKMFTTDMKEAMGEGINIPDITADTIRRMLQFLYTDCTGELDMQSAKDLYIASDKYDIVSLKQLCLTFMKDNLCPANVCELLVLADMHQDKDLESAANEYIMNYDEEGFSSEEWKIFMQNYGTLAARVMFLKIRNK